MRLSCLLFVVVNGFVKDRHRKSEQVSHMHLLEASFC
jgi:hypothetical protein